jgi:coenzyme F420 hydrogenase subunit beta
MIASIQPGLAAQRITISLANNCIECGKCTARCPIASIDKSFSPVLNIVRTLRGYRDEIPREGNIWACMVCEACSDACSAGVDYPGLILGLRAEALITGRETVHKRDLEQEFVGTGERGIFGVCRDCSAIRSASEGDEPGVVTSLLARGMERGLFDAAVLVRRGPGNRAETFIAGDREEIVSAAGSKYELVPVPERLVEAVVERGYRRIASVGLPCQVTATREIQRSLPDATIFVIGLFCMENFRHHLLKETVSGILQIDLDAADAVRITKGVFSIVTPETTRSCRVRELENAVRRGCRFCTDFTAELADISVGMVGSPEGYSTVITRSRKGADLFSLLTDRDRKAANQEEFGRMSGLKRQHGYDRLINSFPERI